MRNALVAGVVGLSLVWSAVANAQAAPPSAEGLTADVVCARGAKLRDVAEYATAAEALTECARRFPRDPRAKAALADAVRLRLGLGDEAEAVRLAGEYVKVYAVTERAMAATVVYAIAAHHLEKEHWDAATDVIAKNQRLLEEAPIDIRTLALVAKGRALAHGAKPEAGYAVLAAAVKQHGDGSSLDAQIASAWPGDDERIRDRRLAKVLTAVGDAMVLLADHAREQRIAELRPPVFAGPRTLAAMREHVTSKVTPWMVRRRTAIEELEASYRAVLDMKPVPPPKATIAAAGAVAMMWADLADDLGRVLPLDVLPPGRTRGPSTTMPTRAEAKAVIEEVQRPIRERQVIPALRMCMNLSAKYLYTDERSQACEAWLVKNDPERSHARSEIAPVVRRYGGEWVRDAPRNAP
jgi:hypothetical protein